VSQALIDKVLADNGKGAFAAHWLHARGLDWAADLLADFPQEAVP
jgi:type IV secretion system protein VirB4